MHKSQTDDYRFIMFVKLFFGMGFLWIFEIIAAICENDDNDDGYFWWAELRIHIHRAK